MNVRALERFLTRLPNDPLVITTGTTAAPAQIPGDLATFRLIVLQNATGLTAQMPRATGSGRFYMFVLGLALSSGNYIINTDPTTDVYQGNLSIDVNASASGQTFIGNAQNTLTLNGSTTGGANKGDMFFMADWTSGIWTCSGTIVGTGSPSTPFS